MSTALEDRVFDETDHRPSGTSGVDRPIRHGGLGWVTGGIMLLMAAVLWSAAYGQLNLLVPASIEELDLQRSPHLKKEMDKLTAVWYNPWRAIRLTWLIPSIAGATIVLCAAIRKWWFWGAFLVAFPLLMNWYISVGLLISMLYLTQSRFR